MGGEAQVLGFDDGHAFGFCLEGFLADPAFKLTDGVDGKTTLAAQLKDIRMFFQLGVGNFETFGKVTQSAGYSGFLIGSSDEKGMHGLA